MKVLTIKQPFASLIMAGLKEYEFRTWKTKYRGEVLIHAGKGIDKEAMKRYKYLKLDYPIGYIIGKVNITDCIPVDDSFKDELNRNNPIVYYGILKGDPTWKGYGFKIENIKKIVPVRISGKLSFWNYEGAIEEIKNVI